MRSSTGRCRWAGHRHSSGTPTVKNQADAEIDCDSVGGTDDEPEGVVDLQGLERKQPVVHGEGREQQLGAEFGDRRDWTASRRTRARTAATRM